jgi:hypothetical protein
MINRSIKIIAKVGKIEHNINTFCDFCYISCGTWKKIVHVEHGRKLCT